MSFNCFLKFAAEFVPMSLDSTFVMQKMSDGECCQYLITEFAHNDLKSVFNI